MTKYLICILMAVFTALTPAYGQELQFTLVAGNAVLGPINCLAIDANGVKWAGTEQGLLRIEGTDKKLYTTGNSSIRDGHINCLIIDAQGNKWMGSYTKGLMRLDAQGHFFHYPFADSRILLITAIAIDGLGQVWASTSQGGIYQLEGNTLVRKLHPKDGKFPSAVVYAMGFLPSGELWAGTAEGLCLVQGQKVKTDQSLEGIRGMLLKDGLLVAGGLGAKGPILWANSSAGWQEVSDFCKPLPPLGKMLKGADYFWLATEEGLLRFDGRSCKRFDQRHGSHYGALTSLAQDLDSTLWVGTAKGQVLHLAPKAPEKPVTAIAPIQFSLIKIAQTFSLQATQFRQGAAILLDSLQAVEELGQIVAYWQSNQHLYLSISGHTDNQGSQIENWKLSRDRANKVGELLEEMGIPSSFLRIAWHGEAKPLTSNDTEVNKAKNRRVEMRFSSE